MQFTLLCFVYITTNPEKTVLYTGMTNNLASRMNQHDENRGKPDSFAGRYPCYKRLYWERFQYVQHAIAREKQLNGWSRKKKEALIATMNPAWNFLVVN